MCYFIAYPLPTFTWHCFIMSWDVYPYCSRMSCWWRWTFSPRDLTWFWQTAWYLVFLEQFVCSHRNSLQNQKSSDIHTKKKIHYCLLYWASSFHLSSLQLAYLRYTLIFSFHPCLYHPLWSFLLNFCDMFCVCHVLHLSYPFWFKL